MVLTKPEYKARVYGQPRHDQNLRSASLPSKGHTPKMRRINECPCVCLAPLVQRLNA